MPTYEELRKKDPNYAYSGYAPYRAASDSPEYPDFIGMDPGVLRNAGPASMQIINEGMRRGPSLGAELAQREQIRQLGLNRDQLKKQALGEAAQAKNALAMKGGLTSGAAERINANMGANALELGQGARQGYAKNMASIGMEDEGNRQKMLGHAANLETQGPGREQAENLARNKFNLDRYNAQMSGWAAGKQAAATADSGKK